MIGCLPWQKASMDDPRYNKYIQWHNSSFPIKRTPKLFKLISAKASKMFRKFLEPKIERRIKTLMELHKYLDERWLARSAEKEMAGKFFATDYNGIILCSLKNFLNFLFSFRIWTRRAESVALLLP